ncbi:CTD small phosphatase-like protein 2 [Coemansia sp. RSA 1933]|nr:CTD small phosphatase-like protein 2 [Coemansia sp. RSA 1933]
MSAATRLRNGTKRSQLSANDTLSVGSKATKAKATVPSSSVKDSKVTKPIAAATQTKKTTGRSAKQNNTRSIGRAESDASNTNGVRKKRGTAPQLPQPSVVPEKKATAAAVHVSSGDAIERKTSAVVGSDATIRNCDSGVSSVSTESPPKSKPTAKQEPSAAAAERSKVVPLNRKTKRKPPAKRGGNRSNGAAKQQKQRQQQAVAVEKSTRKIATAKKPAGTANPTHLLTRDLSKTSISSDESVNFIMSSPKREPRKALSKIGALQERNNATPPKDGAELSKRRRTEDSTDDNQPRSAGFNSPMHKRMRTASAAAVAAAKERIKPSSSRSSEGSEKSSMTVRVVDCVRKTRMDATVLPTRQTKDKESSNSSVNGNPSANVNGSAQSSPFKSILSPVFDLLRRVSGMAQDPLGMQKQDSCSSGESDASTKDRGKDGAEESPVVRKKSKENMQPTHAAAEPEGDCAPAELPEAVSLTAPPMNPTTMGTAAGGLTSFISAEYAESSSGMQLYLPDSNEYIGPDSCSGSPVTPGYPETPSKENIPVYTEHDVLVGLDTHESGITALAPAAGLSEMSAMSAAYPTQQHIDYIRNRVFAGGLHSSDSDLSLSQISSVDDSEFDAQSDSYFAYDDDEDEFNPYLFMANLPPIPKEHTMRPYALPRKTRSSPPITLVLDLDETLVHCALTKVESPDLVFPVDYNGVNYSVYCRLRPGYREFLEKASQLFEVVIFTASQQAYADQLLNLIDPDRRFIRHRLFRDSCVCINTNYVKDLGILGRDAAKMVLVDNCPQAFAYQQSNGIPIESWYEDKNDRELMHLMEFLVTLVGEDDVRPKVDACFKTKEKVLDAKKRYQLKGRRLYDFL